MGVRMPIDLYRVVIPAYPLSIPISKKIVLLVFLVVNKKKYADANWLNLCP